MAVRESSSPRTIGRQPADRLFLIPHIGGVVGQPSVRKSFRPSVQPETDSAVVARQRQAAAPHSPHRGRALPRNSTPSNPVVSFSPSPIRAGGPSGNNKAARSQCCDNLGNPYLVFLRSLVVLEV